MRRIKSSDLPQADRIESVLLAVLAVANGAQTDLEIANKIPGIENDDRQGRYYRNAAEMLGFITNNRNRSILSLKGQKLIKNPVLNNPLFVTSVLSLEIYQKLLPYLELHPEGCERNDILNYLKSISDPNMGPTMIPRRISTILSWPKALGFLRQTDTGRFQVCNNFSADIPVFEIQDDNQPLLPVTGALSEFQELEHRTSNAKDEIIHFKNQAKLDRSKHAHIMLVNSAVQNNLRFRNFELKTNKLRR